jgi:hypothetical protein
VSTFGLTVSRPGCFTAPDLQAVGSNQYSGGRNIAENDVTPSRENKAEYAIRRLRKDRPDIHARVTAD